MEPAHRQLADLIVMPSEVDLVRLSLRTEHEIDRRRGTDFACRSAANRGLKKLAVGFGHLEANRRPVRMERSLSRLESLGHVTGTRNHAREVMPRPAKLCDSLGMTGGAGIWPEIALRIRGRVLGERPLIRRRLWTGRLRAVARGFRTRPTQNYGHASHNN